MRSLVIYLIGINVLTFLIYGIDKWKARRGKWRIPEDTLIWLANQMSDYQSYLIAPVFDNRPGTQPDCRTCRTIGPRSHSRRVLRPAECSRHRDEEFVGRCLWASVQACQAGSTAYRTAGTRRSPESL